MPLRPGPEGHAAPKCAARRLLTRTKTRAAHRPPTRELGPKMDGSYKSRLGYATREHTRTGDAETDGSATLSESGGAIRVKQAPAMPKQAALRRYPSQDAPCCGRAGPGQ